MALSLESLRDVQRLLFAIPLAPVQGSRFQPTGFPGLGAATFQTARGASLLVESAQSMANRLEATIWDNAAHDVVEDCRGISHVRVKRGGAFLTDTVLEAHRLNSPYLLESGNRALMDELKTALQALEEGPVDRKLLAAVLLQFDIGSLLHGVFLAKKELAGGRLRVARALSAFIEADGVRVAASGGVKNDHVNPSGDTKAGFGNVPFARDEFTADAITLYVNLDLAQIRGYGLGAPVERLLALLALYKLRALVNGNLRLRTACDLAVVGDSIQATSPNGFALPEIIEIAPALRASIKECSGLMKVRDAEFVGELKKGKAEAEAADDASDDGDEG